MPLSVLICRNLPTSVHPASSRSEISQSTREICCYGRVWSFRWVCLRRRFQWRRPSFLGDFLAPSVFFFFLCGERRRLEEIAFYFSIEVYRFWCGLVSCESYETVAPWPKGRDSLLGSLHGCDNILIPLLLCAKEGFSAFAVPCLVRYRRQMVESWRLSYFGCANQCQVLCVWGLSHFRSGSRFCLRWFIAFDHVSFTFSYRITSLSIIRFNKILP